MPYNPRTQGKGYLDPGRRSNPPSGRQGGGYAGPPDPSGQSRRKQRRDDIILRGDDGFSYPGYNPGDPSGGALEGNELRYPLDTRAGYYPGEWGEIARQLEGIRGMEGIGGLLSGLSGTMSMGGDIERFLQSAAPFLAASMAGTESFQDTLNWQPRVEQWAQQYGGAPNVMGQYGGIAGQLGQAGAQAQSQGMNRLAQSGLGRSGQMAALASQVAQQTGAQQAGAYGQLSTQQSQIDAQHRQGFANRYLQARNAGIGNAMDAQRVITQMALGYNAQPRTWIDTSGGDEQNEAAFYGGLGQGIGSIPGAIAA